MSSDAPLHHHADTHLYHGDFNAFVSEHATGTVLLITPDGATATTILDQLNATPAISSIETFTGDHSRLPHDIDSFDTTVLFNPTRGILQRHRPLYEATAVTRKDGQIIYRAPELSRPLQCRRPRWSLRARLGRPRRPNPRCVSHRHPCRRPQHEPTGAACGHPPTPGLPHPHQPMTPTPQTAHRFTTSWRWPPDFESWVDALTHGRTANVCAGLSPLGGIRVDLMTPIEVMGLLQDDENTSLEDARAAYSDLLSNDFTGRGVIGDLYDAVDPPTHDAAQYVTTVGHVRANGFDHTLPFPDGAFDTVIADPPWKALPERVRSRFFDELTRITAPAGRLIFNAWWIPTNDHVTLDAIRIQQDANRYPMGTPCISYAAVYTIHESKPIARYLSRTLVDHEYTPTPGNLKEAIEAETAYRLTRIDGIPHTHYEIDIVGPSSRKRCPHCGTRALDPASSASGHHVPTSGDLYVCPSCEYPVTDTELSTIANGDIHRIRYDNDWTTIPPAALHGIDPATPPEGLLKELATEPGLTQETAPAYLAYALNTRPSESNESAADASGLASFGLVESSNGDRY